MNLRYLMDLGDLPPWKLLQNEILSRKFNFYQNRFQAMNSYELVYVLVDHKGNPCTQRRHESDVPSYVIFTQPELAARLDRVFLSEKDILSFKEEDLASQYRLKIMMVGQLVYLLRERKKETVIKINPLYFEVSQEMEPLLFAEEVIFVPQFDHFTNKYLMTDPDEAKPLLGIRPEDERRFGIEIVYYMMTNRGLPDEREKRENILRDKIEELSFMAPRIPLRKGSGSFLAILLNLESELEERAFIRDYKMFDAYGDTIFVTGQLKILSGSLEEIQYNGERIDSIFLPLIKWQRKRALHHHYKREIE